MSNSPDSELSKVFARRNLAHRAERRYDVDRVWNQHTKLINAAMSDDATEDECQAKFIEWLDFLVRHRQFVVDYPDLSDQIKTLLLEIHAGSDDGTFPPFDWHFWQLFREELPPRETNVDQNDDDTAEGWNDDVDTILQELEDELNMWHDDEPGTNAFEEPLPRDSVDDWQSSSSIEWSSTSSSSSSEEEEEEVVLAVDDEWTTSSIYYSTSSSVDSSLLSSSSEEEEEEVVLAVHESESETSEEERRGDVGQMCEGLFLDWFDTFYCNEFGIDRTDIDRVVISMNTWLEDDLAMDQLAFANLQSALCNSFTNAFQRSMARNSLTPEHFVPGSHFCFMTVGQIYQYLWS